MLKDKTRQHGSQISAEAPRLYRDSTNLALELCEKEKLRDDGSKCYPFAWKPWVQETVKQLLGEKYADFEKDTTVQSPGESVVVLPKDTQTVLFSACRQHDCNSFSAYYLIDPKTRAVNIIWKRKKEFIYFGSQEKLFIESKIGQWLEQERNEKATGKTTDNDKNEKTEVTPPPPPPPVPADKH